MRRMLILLAVVALAGCDLIRPDELDPDRWRVRAVEGDGQEAVVGNELRQQLGAQLLQCQDAANCNPGDAMVIAVAGFALQSGTTVPIGFSAVPGELVCFNGTIGAGDPLNACTITDDEGVARTRWRLGYLANRPGARFWIAAFADRDGAIQAIDTLLVRAKPGDARNSFFLHRQARTFGPSPLSLNPCYIRDEYGNPVPYRVEPRAFAHWDVATGSVVADSAGRDTASVIVADTVHARAMVEVSADGTVSVEAGIDYRSPSPPSAPCPRTGY